MRRPSIPAPTAAAAFRDRLPAGLGDSLDGGSSFVEPRPWAIKSSENMTADAPLPLNHSWPLWEQPRHFELGHVLNSAVSDLLEPGRMGQLDVHHAGCWECDLKNNQLTWSGGVYDIFGLPRWAPVRREEAVALYGEGSRAKMERLRAHALKHRRGFTVDVEIRPATGESRWMRLIAAPVCIGGDVVRLHGLKLII